jgi:hypothetical protein
MVELAIVVVKLESIFHMSNIPVSMQVCDIQFVICEVNDQHITLNTTKNLTRKRNLKCMLLAQVPPQFYICFLDYV